MKFGPVPLAEAEGGVLAHSLRFPGGVLKKGRVLSAEDVAQLRAAGLDPVTVARSEPGDIMEDPAAARMVAALVPDPVALCVTVSAPFTGRANVYAQTNGILTLDAGRLSALNGLDEALTIATLPDKSRVTARQMLATVKIIPYGLPESVIREAEHLLAADRALAVHPFRAEKADVILTRTPGMSDKVVEKGAEAVRQRLRALGVEDVREQLVPHDIDAVSAALRATDRDMVLILTGSATSDRADVGPAAVEEAGGDLVRFGMPVDPGNLLFLGRLGARPVVGLPGCARSPKLNGADWVLERLTAGLDVTSADIAGMGVGGLLKEIPSRPQPRTGGAGAPRRPNVAVMVLAAGASSRMGGRDKLLEPVAGEALLRTVVGRMQASNADHVLCVLRPGSDARQAVLADLAVQTMINPRASEGMGTSIAAGVAALPADTDAVVVMLGDMPEVKPDDIDRLIAAYDPAEGRAIVRATSPEGRPGHPVLFGRRFFEALGALEGDQGARSVVSEGRDFVVDVPLAGAAALTDLDTPEDWAAWRARLSG